MINKKNDVILVLGSQGQVGYEITMQLFEEGYQVVTPQTLDITYLNQVTSLADLKPKLIINCAAYTDVDKAESDQEMAFAVNSKAVGYIAALSASIKTPVIHFSTDYVFDGTQTIYQPLDVPNPLSVYGESKLQGENILELLGYKPTILRTSWVFSDRRKNFYKTILRLAMEKDEIRVVNDQIGRPTSAKEISRQISHIIKSDKYHPGTYHLAGGGLPCSWYQFASAIVKHAKAMGYPVKAKVLPCPSSEYKTPVERPKYSVLDTSLLTEAYGCMLKDWEDCLVEYLAGTM